MSGYVFEEVAKAVCRFGGFEFGTGVGRGAFKETFSAVDGAGRAIAVKILKPGCSNERSTREIEAMKRCSHPNVASLIELSSIEFAGTQYTFIIEPFMAGGTLEDRLRTGPFGREQVLRVGGELICAIEHIAAHDLVHRDIKPANIMFLYENSPAVIGDFGIVRDLTKTSLTETFLASGPCTPFFAAPEQLNNEKALIDWRTDQFALATTLTIGHFGAHPYADVGDRGDEAVFRVCSRSGPSKTFVREAQLAGLPILPKMLEPWPVRRFRTPQLLFEAWIAQ